MYADQLYSPENDFIWMKRNYQVGNAEDLLTSLRGQ